MKPAHFLNATSLKIENCSTCKCCYRAIMPSLVEYFCDKYQFTILIAVNDDDLKLMRCRDHELREAIPIHPTRKWEISHDNGPKS